MHMASSRCQTSDMLANLRVVEASSLSANVSLWYPQYGSVHRGPRGNSSTCRKREGGCAALQPRPPSFREPFRMHVEAKTTSAPVDNVLKSKEQSYTYFKLLRRRSRIVLPSSSRTPLQWRMVSVIEISIWLSTVYLNR